MEAFRFGQPWQLVGAVNADFVLFFGCVEFQEFAQVRAGAEGKRPLAWRAHAGVALGAKIDQSWGFEPSRVQNVRHFLRIGMVALIGRVARAGPVAPLAGDAEDETIPVVRVTGIGFRFEPGCVALQASGDDAAGEVHLAVRIARAVDPPLLLREVGDGQLVEAVALPEEIGLADLSGAGDNVDALGPPVPTLPFSDDGRLIETGFVGGDFEAKIGIAGPDGGVVRRETAQNCFGTGQAGGEMVCCAPELLESVPVTLRAGLGANVAR